MSIQSYAKRYRFVGIVATVLFVQAAAASAEVVSTDEVLGTQQAQSERERIKAVIERADVAKQLEALGIAPEQARDRVDAMTDAEIQTLAGKIDKLPAGAALSNYELILILLVIILLVLLI